MAFPPGINEVQDIIGYTYKQINLGVQALTAAGADETNHDGNRRLAQLGESLIEFILVSDSFGSSRGQLSRPAPSLQPLMASQLV
jgi:dsRNA-specific ribonuclease